MRIRPIAAALASALALTAALPAVAHDDHKDVVRSGSMAYFDVDQDGFVSREEFFQGAPEFNGPVFIYADLDNDGVLTPRELYRAEKRVKQNESKRWRRK